MKILRALALLFALACGAVVFVAAAGVVTPLVLVALAPLVIGLVVCIVLYRAFGSHERDAARAAELPTHGHRRIGRVRDAVPLASASGGAVFRPEGAQMVLRVELVADGSRSSETVTVYVVEDSERARGRIGSEVVVLEHPNDSRLRALEGFLPNGRPLAR